jgi:two-component sensor histidine kinase
MGRLRALQAAQSLLAITSEGFTLLKLIEAALLPLAPSPGRLRTRGEDVILPAQTLSMLALVLNELATNALKYGAWSNAGGEVDLRWTYSGRGIVLEWRERGGPPVELPVREGAGSTLIRAAIPDSIVDFRLEPDGLQCTIAIGLQ